MVFEFEELERKAMAGEMLPEDLPQPQQLLFLSLRSLYREYRNNVISRDEAKKEKGKLLGEYSRAYKNYQIYVNEAQRRNKISRYLSEININGCEKCKLAVRIFDGREA